MTRYASVIELLPDKIEEYVRLHDAVWPEVYARLTESNFTNFTIFHRQFPDEKHYLFMYYEYTGHDHEADSNAISADAKTQEWWLLTDPCQKPLDNRAPGEKWASMAKVCHKP